MVGLFPAAVMGVTAMFSLATAVLSLRDPAGFGALLGLAPLGESGTNEIRAQYGGFFFMTGVVGLLAVAGVVPLAGGLLLGTAVFGGLIAGRVASLAVGERFAGYTPTIKQLFVVDSVGFALCLTAMLRTA